MNALVKKEIYLPTTLKELSKFVLIGREKLVAVRAEIRAIDKLGLAKDVREQKKEEATMLAGALLDAEAKLGEILKDTPIQGRHCNSGGTMPTLPKGITRNQSSQFQKLAEHPEIVEQVKAEAIENDDLPTRTDVLKRIKETEKEAYKNELSRQGKGKTIPKGIDLRCGDFKKVLADVPENSVDLILTDPPYSIDYINCWSNLSEFSAKKLKPSGFLIAYSGQQNLPEVIKRLSENLVYYWTFCLYHIGQTQIVNGVNVICRWKPILIYQKEPKKKFSNTIQDYVESEKRQKDGHEWQQGESAVGHLLELFSEETDLICDPFVGVGTVPKMCKKMNRCFVGAEIEEHSFNIAKGGIYDKTRV